MSNLFLPARLVLASDTWAAEASFLLEADIFFEELRPNGVTSLLLEFEIDVVLLCDS
jgi:hypothetical protein